MAVWPQKVTPMEPTRNHFPREPRRRRLTAGRQRVRPPLAFGLSRLATVAILPGRPGLGVTRRGTRRGQGSSRVPSEGSAHAHRLRREEEVSADLPTHRHLFLFRCSRLLQGKVEAHSRARDGSARENVRGESSTMTTIRTASWEHFLATDDLSASRRGPLARCLLRVGSS